MKLYAEVRHYRAGQMIRDALTLLWVTVWVFLGIRVYELVDSLGAAGRRLEEGGSEFAGTLESVGDDLADVPVVGGILRAPFEAIAGGGRAVQQAGETQQDVVHTLALYLGVLLALIPILLVVVPYLYRRVRWIREATAAHRLRVDADDLHLFALRAIATRSLTELQRATPDPAGALAAGDYAPLAALELGALGLRAQT
jgi:hypothetical protein